MERHRQTRTRHHPPRVLVVEDDPPIRPIVLVTAERFPDACAETIGAAACVSKPFDVDSVIATVGSLLPAAGMPAAGVPTG